jgi:hypothetical protein
MDLDPLEFTAFLREAYKAVPTDPLFAPLLFASKESEPYHAKNLGLSVYTWQMFNATTKITQLPWFTGVWVTQEFALGQRQPWALLEDRVFAMEALLDIMESILPRLTREASGSLGEG